MYSRCIYRPGKFAKIGEFADVWEREVLQHQKPSSIKAVKSHLRTYIRPWLAEMRMEEFTGQAQQIFVTRLSGKVSRKSVQNVMGTLASMLKTAKSWGYVAHPVEMKELTLPVETIPSDPRCFTAADLRRIAPFWLSKVDESVAERHCNCTTPWRSQRYNFW